MTTASSKFGIAIFLSELETKLPADDKKLQPS
jgi:hypothetical protein